MLFKLHQKMKKSYSDVIHTDMMKKKTTKERSNLYTKKEIEAALQLIQLHHSLKNNTIISCMSSTMFDLVQSDDEDATKVVDSVRKIKKFRSIADIYNVSKPL